MIFEGIKAKRETPTPVIFGTDWWSDCDDVAALAILLKAHKHGLTEAQKALVENSDVLAAAQTTYADLQAAAEQLAADTAAADAVEALIAEIGEVTYTDESKAKIDAAQAAFDALTEAHKALVENSDVLAATQARYAELKVEAEKDDGKASSLSSLFAMILSFLKYLFDFFTKLFR